MPAATMAKETVVITGATGFIGGRVLQLLLEQDYNLRIVARTDAKKQALLNNPRLKGIKRPSSSLCRISWLRELSTRL